MGIIITMDVLMTRIMTYAFFVVNIISAIKLIITQGQEAGAEPAMIEIIVSILFTICATRGIRMLVKFFNDSLNEVQETAARNEQVSAKIIEVAEDVDRKMGDVDEAVKKIGQYQCHYGAD